MVGRVNRFNILKQSKDYDPDGHYVKTWLPELTKVPAPKCFEPWNLSASEQEKYGVTIGQDYPNFKEISGEVAYFSGKGKGSKTNRGPYTGEQAGARFYRPDEKCGGGEGGGGEKRQKKQPRDRRGGKGGRLQGKGGAGSTAEGNAKREARFEAQKQRKQHDKAKRSEFDMYN